jgi:hypothetical protein
MQAVWASHLLFLLYFLVVNFVIGAMLQAQTALFGVSFLEFDAE